MTENVSGALQALRGFLDSELRSRIELFVERAVQELADQPYTSFSARQQARVAERWLAKQRGTLESSLHQRLLDVATGKEKKAEPTYEELRLLDDDSLNVVMLRARLVNSVMDKAREGVVALEVRLEALQKAGAQLNTRAFSPGAIADGFMAVLDRLAVPTEAQIALMEAYSHHGADMLVELYRDLNELLAKSGVVPDYKYSVVKEPGGKGKDDGGPGGAPGGAGAPAGGTPGAGGAAGFLGPGYAAAHAAAADAEAGGPGKGKPDWVPPWPQVAAGATMPAHFAQLLDFKLNMMSQALSHLTEEHWKPGTLRDTFHLPPPFALSEDQEESIDHIEAVFLDLIRDQRISGRFRGEFNRLILPMMSLRLSDAELFKNPDNPVRRFIRQLALLGFRDKETPIREFEHIALLVGRIVSERAQELSSFKTGADALYTIARNEVQLQLDALHHARGRISPEVEQAYAQKAEEAVKFAQEALRAMSLGLPLPAAVQQCVLRLLAPWIMLQYQLYGEDHEQVREAVLAASLFFSLLEPAIDKDKHTQRVKLRRRSLEHLAIAAAKTDIAEAELRLLFEGIADFFETLDADPKAGLVRSKTGAQEMTAYLDRLEPVRAH